MPLPQTPAPKIGHRATLGLIVLQSDETIEPEFRRMVDAPGTALYTTRIPSDAEVTAETLARMEADLPRAASLLPPSLDFDVIGYGCTSGATVIGPDKVAGLVRSARTTHAVTDPLTALTAAAQALGVTRLAFISPYVAEVSAALREALIARGLSIPRFASFEIAEEARVARISPASVADAAREIGAADEAEAVFLSCTNLRTLDVIGEVEAALGKPVLSSNLVLAWHMRRLAGIREPVAAMGRLMSGT